MHSHEWLEAFNKFVLPEPNSGCWLWTGHVSIYGYAKFAPKWKVPPLYAHRFSYEVHVGPIPPEMVIDHKCRVRCCVNPDHLEVVTQKENVRRGLHIALRPLRTHCKNGHELVDGNFYLSGRTRVCLECERIRGRERYRTDPHYRAVQRLKGGRKR